MPEGVRSQVKSGHIIRITRLAIQKSVVVQGCVDKIIDGFKGNLGAIAGGAIVLGLMQVSVNQNMAPRTSELLPIFSQIVGIVLACFVALYKKENKYEVVQFHCT